MKIMCLGEIKMKPLLRIGVFGVIAITLCTLGTQNEIAMTSSSDSDIMKTKVGCSPPPCWEHYTTNGSACWLAEVECSDYQKYIPLPPPLPPIEGGCLPDAHWDTGCGSDDKYFVYGDRTYIGYKEQPWVCSDWHQWGDCEPDWLNVCVPEDSDNDARCNGSPDKLTICL